MTAEGWIAAYAEALGLPPPDPATVERVLRLAAVAAHASERRAAPLACHLAALSGLSVDEAIARAEALG